jgi:predicted nucleic acid-binding Zn ribbon protein
MTRSIVGLIYPAFLFRCRRRAFVTLFVLVCAILAVSSQRANENENENCYAVGDCEPCPESEVFIRINPFTSLLKAFLFFQLHAPFCQPFGNRRRMYCTQPASETPQSSEDPHPSGEIVAWESCGRIVEKERADFLEFVACNALFAALALGVLFLRSKRLKAQQARQLAARIGLVRSHVGNR